MDSSQFFSTLQRMASTANASEALRRLGRFCAVDFLLVADETGAYVSVKAGEITALQAGPRHLRSYHFAIRAPAPHWAEFWSLAPRPEFHDIFALARFGHATIDGDLDPLLAHLPYFKRLLWLPREFA